MKPVIAFGSKINAYTGYHPNAYRCDDIYDLSGLISEALSTEFDTKANEKYFKNLFSNSSEIKV